ncbi:MAG: glutamate 5-kinase [Chloroflexi bacterium]|nr:glutamate 5-kinase [Chloroflexota bacterium]
MSNKNEGQTPALKYKRIVAKIGTNVLTAGTDRLNMELMADFAAQVAALHKQGAELIVVTSGAIATGRHRLGLKERKDIPFRQVLAAVGQSDLMQAYQQLFARHDITIAQTLLTRRDLADRVGYLNARNTLLAMLELGIVPIVNENDVVAVDEIEGPKIGDNDNLSAFVANLVDADLLAILTDIGGLFSADPRVEPAAELIQRVEKIDEQIEALAGGTTGHGVGGMATKIQAARLATGGGTDVFIASGREADTLKRLAHGEALGTHFPAAVDRMESRKRWMLAALSVKGDIVVDDGASKVLREKEASLLAAGIQKVEGAFSRGDTVAIVDSRGKRIACGITNYSSDEIERIRGIHSDKIEEVLGHHYGSEVLHRNNMVLL